jgi:hypothetical protein
MIVRPLLASLVLTVPACWSSSPAAQHEAPANVAANAPDDSTLMRDLEGIGAFLRGGDEAFTSVELIGWTATRGIIYRTAVCDPDELGGRGAYCSAQVCVAAGPALDTEASCDTPVDETVEDTSSFDRRAAAAAIRSAVAAQHSTGRGHAEDVSLVTVTTKDGDLSVAAPAWFGPSSWTLFRGDTDPDSGELHGFKDAVITSVRSSDDGACLAFAGTALRSARYESVVGNIRVAFAARRCR